MSHPIEPPTYGRGPAGPPPVPPPGSAATVPPPPRTPAPDPSGTPPWGSEADRDDLTRRQVRALQDPRRLSSGPRRLLWTTFLGVALATVIALIPLPYAVLRPGPATNTLGMGSDGKAMIDVLGHQTYPTSGALDFTTVSVSGGPERRVNAWDLVAAWLRPSWEVRPERELFPEGVTREQVTEENTLAMTDSQREATAVALKAIGAAVGHRFIVGGITTGSPAEGTLELGDAIVQVDGERMNSIPQIQKAIQDRAPGEKVSLVVLRDGTSKRVSAITTDIEGKAALGVRLQVDFDFPFEVRINAGDVGGPSAGTMFALAIYDVLTPGEFTGGKKIAGTGTIDEQGSVGPIGGVRQKVVGAKNAGAGYFLAPAQNCQELSGHVPDGITVVRVATFEEARTAVERIATGNPDLPRCG